MAVKNVAAKSWTSLLTSFDGRKWSAWPAGDKPTGYLTTPQLLNTDIIAGSMTGGEFNKGAYLRIICRSPGRKDQLGASGGCRVYFRDPIGDNAWHEVDNYRYLTTAPTYDRNQAMEVCVQIGSFGGAIANGRACDIKITVNGVDSNVLVGQFTTQPGNFYFVDNVNGSDASGVVNDIAHPYRYWSKVSSGTTYTGIWAVFAPGDTIVGRQNIGTPYSDNAGYDGKNIRFAGTKTGNAPTGAASHGYIHFTSYPGPICVAGVGGNAPERCQYHGNTSSAGFIHGTSDTYIATTGKYWTVSCIDIDGDPAAPNNFAGVNFQSGSDFVRITLLNVGPWLSTALPPNNAKSAGIGGQGDNIYEGYNVVHDWACNYNNPGNNPLENHGTYIGGATSTSHNWLIEGNWYYNISGGSGCNIFDQTSTDSTQFTGNVIRFNWFENCGKHGVNHSQNARSTDIYGNVFVHINGTGVAFNSGSTNQTVRVTHNLFFDCQMQGDVGGSENGYIDNINTAGAGSSLTVKHNMFVMPATRNTAASQYKGVTTTNTQYYTTYSPDTNNAVSFAENLFFDPDGPTAQGGTNQAWGQTAPAKDATPVAGNPLFTDASTGNYTSSTGGAALGACTQAESIAIAVDYYGIARPVTGTSAPGGTKNDLGPFQGVGT